jgi:hypothetical protein
LAVPVEGVEGTMKMDCERTASDEVGNAFEVLLELRGVLRLKRPTVTTTENETEWRMVDCSRFEIGVSIRSN